MALPVAQPAAEHINGAASKPRPQGQSRNEPFENSRMMEKGFNNQAKNWLSIGSLPRIDA
jgi:hypothetical protein